MAALRGNADVGSYEDQRSSHRLDLAHHVARPRKLTVEKPDAPRRKIDQWQRRRERSSAPGDGRKRHGHFFCELRPYCAPIVGIDPIAGIEKYTIRGYREGMRKDSKASCAKRLNRIEGQVRGIARMVDEDRYCIDIVTQIAAVRAALRRVEEEILRDHVGHCVEHAITSGNKSDQRRKIEELMNVVSRAER
jgi:CsoR family transcriptional regulator, copper-sensing transcriptional repressor